MACIVLNKMAKVVAAVAIVLSFLSFKKALERRSRMCLHYVCRYICSYVFTFFL